jgi:anti-anti-sigma factor
MMDFRQDGNTLHIAGRFTMGDMEEFRSETDKLLRKNPDQDLIFEMGKCVFMNSIALGHILRVYKALNEKNHRLIIKNPSQEARVYFEVTKVSNLVDIVD